jgi:hypothetical protein
MLSGCATYKSDLELGKPATARLVNLQRGITLQQLEAEVGAKATHQFTIRTNEQTLRCVSYRFSKPNLTLRYDFLFRDDALEKVLESPPLARRQVPGYDFLVTNEPEKRVATVVDTPDLQGEALAESLARTGGRKSGQSLDILPAFIVLLPLAPILIADGQAQNRHRREAAKHFDPFRITLGMTAEEVEVHFGKSVFSDPMEATREVHFHGNPKIGWYSPPWLAVVYDRQKVTKVFSGYFFDSERVRDYLRATQVK